MPVPEAAALLTVPGGGAPLRPDGDAFVSEDGRRFRVERGIVRTLHQVDSALAAELAAQEVAKDIYLDERLLLPRYEEELARFAVEELFRDGRGGTAILDAGCGIGLLGRLYPSLGIVGLDASMPLLEQARGYRLLVEGSTEALPFADGSFDAVLSLNTLHHV